MQWSTTGAKSGVHTRQSILPTPTTADRVILRSEATNDRPPEALMAHLERDAELASGAQN